MIACFQFETGAAIPLAASWPVGELILSLLLWLALILVPALLFFCVVYLLFSLPLRRRERARLFLDLLKTTLKQGRPLEETLVSISQTRDAALGVRFHLLAAHLEQGLSFSRALAQVPRLLPPRVVSMLRAGEHIGDLEKVIPACRRCFQDAISETRTAVNYLVALAFVVTPLSALLPLFLFRLVVPEFEETFASLMPASSPPALLDRIGQIQPWLSAGLIMLCVVLGFGALVYVGGPRFTSWLQAGIPHLLDAVLFRLPWQRKRMQRDFSGVLAVLLDADVPEPQALELAGACTANAAFRRRVQRAVRELEQGAALADALARIDDSGEFQWRLANAARGRQPFLRALEGWLEALDAKAYQQEQAASQGLTTALVLLNGAFVGLVLMTVFGALVAIIDAGVLW